MDSHLHKLIYDLTLDSINSTQQDIDQCFTESEQGKGMTIETALAVVRLQAARDRMKSILKWLGEKDV